MPVQQLTNARPEKKNASFASFIHIAGATKILSCTLGILRSRVRAAIEFVVWGEAGRNTRLRLDA